MEIYFCEECRSRVSDAEIAAGEAVRDEDSVFCKPCALKLGIYQRAREAAAPEEAPPRRPPSRRRKAAPVRAGSRSQALIFLACGVGAVVITALAVVLVRRRGRERAEPPIRRVVRGPVAPARRPMEVLPAPTPAEEDRVPDGRVEPPPLREKPAPPPPPKPPPPPPAREAREPQPVPEGWIGIFNGRDMKGWQHAGGRAYVGDGALVSTNRADLWYKAAWEEFALACELRAGGGESENTMAVGLAQSRMGRGSSRVRVTFHNDGDAHVHGAGKRLWRSGGGKFPLADWTPLRLELRRKELKIFKDDRLAGTVDISQVPAQKGGVYFFSYGDHTARMRNARVRVLSQ